MPPIEQINDTTYGFKMPSGDIVEVGDKKSTLFKPHLKINRWGGECWIAPSIEQAGAVGLRVKDDLVESESNLSLIRMYPIAPSEQWELGSFRMEITHKKKPKTNKVLSNILSHNVVAHYQPPLTQKEIEEGAIRPDNIIGSYAFKHATRYPMHAGEANALKYQGCKVGHKPRPRIVDDNGDWCWAELSIDLKTGLQVITIPLEFYEYAKYPIRHDAGADTFGYTGAGGSTFEGSADLLISVTGGYTGAAGTGVSISFYVVSGTYDDGPIAFALSKVSDDAFVKATDEIGTPTSGDWNTANFTDAPTLEAIDYYIVHWGEEYSLAFDDTGKESLTVFKSYPATWPDPINLSGTNVDREFLCYCTYTPEAPPAGAVGRLVYGGLVNSGLVGGRLT